MLLPKNEKRLFETDILSNGVKCIYIEDKYLDTTSIAVTINVGSLAEPKEYMGLAHFLEHMLFMGSKKYPIENYYEQVVKKYGGSSNAYTGDDLTCYYFSIFNNGIEHLTDVFSQFFIEPLFLIDSINREINAINSEHQKNINNDYWRLQQLLHNISIKNHNYNKFTTGNFNTLKKDNNKLREQMISFFNDYYVSNNIGVCIISKLKISEQKKIIQNSFGLIKNKKGKQFIIEKPIYNISNTTYQMIPTTDVQSLTYYWEIDNHADILLFNKTKLMIIFGSLLASSNKTSLQTYLKNLGLIENIKYTYDSVYGIFGIKVNLTIKGLDNLNIIDGTLKYTIKKIIESFDSDYNNIINYYKKIFQLNFDYGEKDDSLDLCLFLSNEIHNYKLNNIIEEIGLITKIDPSIKLYNYIKDCFKILITKKNISKLDQIDSYYSTQYGIIENIDYPIILFNFSIDLTNPFLNMKPKLVKKLDCHKIPKLIDNKLWYGGCSNFNETIIKTTMIFG
jgi:insulysin